MEHRTKKGYRKIKLRSGFERIVIRGKLEINMSNGMVVLKIVEDT